MYPQGHTICSSQSKHLTLAKCLLLTITYLSSMYSWPWNILPNITHNLLTVSIQRYLFLHTNFIPTRSVVSHMKCSNLCPLPYLWLKWYFCSSNNYTRRDPDITWSSECWQQIKPCQCWYQDRFITSSAFKCLTFYYYNEISSALEKQQFHWPRTNNNTPK